MGGSSQVETHGDDMTPAVKGHSWYNWSEHTSAKRNQVNRTRLAGATVEALLCFQDWLRAAGM